MHILVTGAAGFIGSNLALRLAADGHAVVGADSFLSATWRNLVPFTGDVVTVDTADDADTFHQLRELGPFDVIFHQASITDTTVTDQRQMMHNNVEAFRNILQLAGEWGSRVIWASSASIYGQNPAPNTETQPPQPLNVYAYSKLAIERLADQWRASGRLKQPLIGLRYFNVYGPGEDHKGKFASMIHQLAKQMRAGKRPRIFTPGEQKRDFVYVDDVIQANLKALASKEGGVFNVGSGKAFSFNQVVAELNRVLKTDLQPDYFENPYSFTQDWTQAEISYARRVLGYEPKYDVPRGIDAYFATGKLGV